MYQQFRHDSCGNVIFVFIIETKYFVMQRTAGSTAGSLCNTVMGTIPMLVLLKLLNIKTRKRNFIFFFFGVSIDIGK